MKKLLFIVLASVFAFSTLHAQKPEVITSGKPGWHKIGDANVNFKTEKDEFVIMGKDRFKALRVQVMDAPVHIEDMQVVYEGDKKEDIQLRSNLKAGTKSRVIDLKNKSAELKKVTFVYHTVPNVKSDKAHIELWGLK